MTGNSARGSSTGGGLTACTIVAHNYLPRALVLARSFLEFHPEGRVVILVIDHPASVGELGLPGVEAMPLTDLEFDAVGWRHLATMYTVTELATAVKPFLLRQLLDDAGCVLYLDPDIKLFAPLDQLIERTRANGIALTPHRLTPVPRDGLAPSEEQLMASGIYNLGFIGVADGAQPFLDWWAERLSVDCVSDISRQLFTDQRWIDLALPIFDPYVERSPAYNVAYWNLDALDLEERPDGIFVGDEPLRFFHFSGFDPDRPWLLSTHHGGRPRVLLSERPLLAHLCEDYAEELLIADDARDPDRGYGWSSTPEGVELDAALRAFIRSEVIRAVYDGGTMPPTPFDEDGGAAFRRLLVDQTDVPWGLPLIAYLAWCQRHDLQVAYYDLENSATRDAFMAWIHTNGVVEHPGWAKLEFPVALQHPELTRTGRRPHGVDLVGYLTTESGLGDAGRRLAIALQAADVPLSTADCNLTLSRRQTEFPTVGDLRHDTLLLAVNADQVRPVVDHFGPDLAPGGPVIGQWFWEVNRFPESMAPAFGLVDELWVPTRHIADALEPWAGDKPVMVMPLPLHSSDPSDAEPDQSPPGDHPLFLFVFDFLSVFERKNPMAVVDAFRRAFPPRSGPRLLIKSINGHLYPTELERLRWAARDRQDIEVSDGYLASKAMDALVRRCACYVSLHRAEGLGLTLAAAMTAAKPVIATAYSGNLEFMSPETSHLVPYEPTPVGPGHGPYPPDAWWAEPDVACAARAMQLVVDDPAAAVAMGRRAQADLAERFSPAVTGRRMKERLEQLW